MEKKKTKKPFSPIIVSWEILMVWARYNWVYMYTFENWEYCKKWNNNLEK